MLHVLATCLLLTHLRAVLNRQDDVTEKIRCKNDNYTITMKELVSSHKMNNHTRVFLPVSYINISITMSSINGEHSKIFLMSQT